MTIIILPHIQCRLTLYIYYVYHPRAIIYCGSACTASIVASTPIGRKIDILFIMQYLTCVNAKLRVYNLNNAKKPSQVVPNGTTWDRKRCFNAD